MENLFRLMLVRPAVAQDPENPSIDLTQDSPYQRALRKVVQDGGGRKGAETATAAYVGGPDYLGDPAGNPLADRLAALAARLDELETGEESRDLGEIISEIFEASPAEVIETEEFGATLERLRDSLMAIKVLQQEHSRPIEELARQLRTMEVIAKAAGDECFPETGRELRRWRRRTLQLPVELGLGSRLSTRKAEKELRKQREKAVAERREQVTGLLERHERLRVAIDELGGLASHHFEVTAQAGSDAVLPPKALQLESALAGASAYVRTLRSLHVGQQEPGEPIGDPGTRPGRAAAPEPAGEATVRAATVEAPAGANGADGHLAAAAAPGAELAATLLANRPEILPGRAIFAVPELSDIGFVLKPTAVEALSEGTRALLEERKVDLTAAPLDRATERLSLDLAATVGELELLAGHPVKQSFVRIGDALVSVKTPVTTGWGAIGTGGFLPFPLLPLDGRIPHTKGEVAPAGVADLLVVRQQLTGYEGVGRRPHRERPQRRAQGARALPPRGDRGDHRPRDRDQHQRGARATRPPTGSR